MSEYRKKLIEVALPLEAINTASAREKSIRHGHPSALHPWWARRPLAACRAVLFGQLVDDPSSWSDLFPTEAAQDKERQRLFRIIEELVLWENSNNEVVINAARLEIARSVARNRKANGEGNQRDDAVLTKEVEPAVVNKYLAEVAPPVHDPFAGGGSIPLEAQRLGLRAIATDLNPVAVLINKALIEIPPKFAGMPPVNPESRRKAGMRTWKGAEGLAEDVRYYGKWMRDEAFKRLGHLYPPVKVTREMAKGRPDLEPHVGKELTVIAWLWVRTVASPNPAMKGTHVPLVSSFWLSKKPGKEAWVEPVVDAKSNGWRFDLCFGRCKDTRAVDAGTKTGRGDFRCVLSGDPIPTSYLRTQAQAGGFGSRLLAVVAQEGRDRIYLPPTPDGEATADSARSEWMPDELVTTPSHDVDRLPMYGMRRWGDAFTQRQLATLTAAADLLPSTVALAVANATAVPCHGIGSEYGEAIPLYLALAISKATAFNNSLCRWRPQENKSAPAFGRQALTMVWDFAEVNPFAGAGGDLLGVVEGISGVLDRLPQPIEGRVDQSDSVASWTTGGRELVSTDPPYYDNVGYADLSDFFYVWLRRMLRKAYPDVLRTVMVPKAAELTAMPHRHPTREAAETFFRQGMEGALKNIAAHAVTDRPTAIYYAFKQSEKNSEGTASTGWETFLDGVLAAGFAIGATWPVRTEGATRMTGMGTNALASSVVLTCRPRLPDARGITRSDFRRLLRQELPRALRALQKGNIAPVDMAQASIGPGMAVFSRHAKVIEADGSAMTVRTALQLINEALDEYLAEQTGEFGPDTRFAVTWFESNGFDTGKYGDAETLAKARNVSVQGVVESGILHSAAGKVRLLKRSELPDDWEPETDDRLTVWECTQHLIKRLEGKGEAVAADLLSRLGDKADPARDLAYRLYQTCERKGWAEEARAYNGLVVAWPELAKLAAQQKSAGPAQGSLFE